MDKYENEKVITEEEMFKALENNGISSNKINEQLKKHSVKAENLIKDENKTQKVLAKGKWICDMLSRLPFIGFIFTNAGSFCNLISDYIAGSYKNVPLATIIAILGSIIYLVSPIDLLPDALPIIGALDDATVILIVTKAAKNDLETYKLWKDNLKKEVSI